MNDTSFSIAWEKPAAVYELENLVRTLNGLAPSYVDKERLGF